jgi:hypothetical protein
MKQRWLTAFFFFALGFFLAHAADPPPAIASLMATMQKASETHDLALMKSCYDLDGASEFAIDIELAAWQENWNENSDTHWTYSKMEYQSFAEIQSNKTINQRAIDPNLGPQKMGEHTYVPNLTVIGFITTTFKDAHGSSMGRMASVGMTPDGTAKIISLRKVP